MSGFIYVDRHSILGNRHGELLHDDSLATSNRHLPDHRVRSHTQWDEQLRLVHSGFHRGDSAVADGVPALVAPSPPARLDPAEAHFLNAESRCANQPVRQLILRQRSDVHPRRNPRG